MKIKYDECLISSLTAGVAEKEWISTSTILKSIFFKKQYTELIEYWEKNESKNKMSILMYKYCCCIALILRIRILLRVY